MGDPETEVVMPRIESDLVELFEAVANNSLGAKKIAVSKQTCCTVMMVAGGYPEAYEKGNEITGLDKVNGSIAFHAGTKLVDGKVLTNGGRVLAVSSLGSNKDEALSKSYANLGLIKFKDCYFRRDIGKDLDKYL